MPSKDRVEMEWAPRVSLQKIRALYENEARGTCDDALIDEVGYGLYSHCLSILEFTKACNGRVLCKRCIRSGTSTILARKTGKPDEILCCPNCGWQIRWRVYVSMSEKSDGQLHAGHAIEAFQRFVEKYPRCHSHEEKILAIDRLIHEFHWILAEGKDEADSWKPAGVNLLRGNTNQVLQTLNTLTYGEHTPVELTARRDWWAKQKSIQRRKDQI